LVLDWGRERNHKRGGKERRLNQGSYHKGVPRRKKGHEQEGRNRKEKNHRTTSALLPVWINREGSAQKKERR